MIRRLLGLGAAACLVAGTSAGGASAAVAGSIWQVVPSENPHPHLVTDSSLASVSMASASPAPGSAGRTPDDSLDGAASLTGGLVFAVGARDVPGQCCLRTLGLMTSAG